MSVALNQTLHRALALYEEGNLHEAETLCDAVLVLDPENLDALQIVGLARLAQGENETARGAFEQGIALAPDDVGNYVNMATANLRLGKPELALRDLHRALAIRADIPEAHHNLGNTLTTMGHPDDAVLAFRKAISLKPDYPEALNNLGQILRDKGETDEAIALFERAIDLDPEYGPPWSNLCAAFLDHGRFEDALVAGRRSVLLLPESTTANYNLGNAHAKSLNPVDAAACYLRSLEIDPKFVPAHVNFGVMQQNLGDCDSAIAAFDQALEIDADDAGANWNKALTLLLTGRMEEAWPLYEWRWQALKKLTKPTIAAPLWDGSSGNGTILLYCEQAYGDAIQFVRYLPMVRERGWRIVLECGAKLERLFADSGLADVVFSTGVSRPPFDCWLPTMSLPGVFNTTLKTVPCTLPYLKARQEVAAERTALLKEDTLNVGIVWQGSLTNDRAPFRSSSLADFALLRDVEGVSLFSVQSQLSAPDAALLKEYSIPDLESGLKDFADTAAIVQKLDLVITVDTAMAHLAGALGREVWVLVPKFVDWRWMLDRHDSPWYPGMRLFRQSTIGDWRNVLREVASALKRRSVEGGSDDSDCTTGCVRALPTASMTDLNIPVMRPRSPNADALRPYLEEIDANGWYSNFGPLERRLEKRLADHFRLPKENVVCVANCTVGLMLALAASASAPGRGGYCVMPSFTFVASAHAALAAGLTPLFVDVDADSWGITAEQASEAVRAADGDVAAIMAVSPFGAPVDVAIWDEFTEKYGVPVVIDAAGGFDSVVPGQSPVVVSLHATKVLPAGEGGAVLSRDPGLINSVFARSNFGFREGRRADVIGFNGKLNEYCAAVGLASLDAWPVTRASFAHLTELYRDALGGIDNVHLAPGFGEGWVGSTCNIRLELPIAEKLMAVLAEAGIDSRQWWSKGCHREKAFAGYPHGDLPVTDFLGQRVVGIPFYEGIGSADIARIAGMVATAARG